jgi:hypothetical protein
MGQYGFKFSQDPVAEYLAAWHVYTRPNRKLAGGLKRRIAKAQVKNAAAAQGLLDAMNQVAQITGNAPG